MFRFQKVEIVRRARAGTVEQCRSTGGTVRYTEHGLIHTGGRNYTGRTAEREQKEVDTEL